MTQLHRKWAVTAATASVALSIIGQAHAATDTFAPTTPLTGTYATGAVNQQNVTYYQWAVGATPAASNFTPGYAVGDDVVFDQATGTYVIASTTTLDPNSVSFTGGATYDFTRASTTANANVFFGGTYILNGQTYGGVDSFNSNAFVDANVGSGSGTFNFTLGSNFTGKVILRSRPVAINGGATLTNTVNNGTLEIHDASALFAVAQNNPSLTLNGGTFAVNIDTGNVAFAQGNIAPSSSQLGGTLTVGGNATLANNSVDSYGRSRVNAVWQGAIAFGTSGATLTVNTGGGTQFGGASGAAVTGTGTVLIGTESASNAGTNRLRLNGATNSGSATVNWNLGTNGIIENTASIGGTTNFGSLTGQSATLLRGTTTAANGTTGASTLAAGANGTSTTFAGSIVNGNASVNQNTAATGAVTVTGTNAPTALVAAGARSVANSNFTKNGAASTLTLSGANVYGGTTTVNAGTLIAQSAQALGTGSGAVTVAAAGTLDLQATQSAGKSFILAGGSLVNNNSTPVTIGTGASGNFSSITANGGTGVWAGAGNSATVAFSAPTAGGTQATGQVLLQLGFLSGSTAGAASGSGYNKEPILTFSNPDSSVAGARPIKATVQLNTSGQVAGITILDPGYGYTSVPTVSVDNTGTGGSGFSPVFTMTGNGIRMTNAGSGYTAAPTLSFGGTGYEVGTSAGLTNTAVGVGGYGNVSLTATSNVGGSGSLTIAAPISGAFGLNKVGIGTTTLTGVNAFSGGATASAGTLATGSTGDLGTGNVTVANLATILSLGNASSIADTASLTFAANSLVQLNALGGTSEVLAAITNATSGATLSANGTYTAAQLNTFFGVASFSSLSGETVTIGSAVPEPASLAVLGLAGIGMLSRRRRQA